MLRPILLGMALSSLAQTAPAGVPIRVEFEGLPAPLHRAGASGSDPIQVDAKVEASAVEPIGDGSFLLVAHDKASEFYVVEAATGRIVGEPATSDALPPTTANGPKWEAMARDSAGNFYAMGSHSGKTDAEKAERAHLVRFRLKAEPKSGGEGLQIDPASVRKFDVLAPLASALGKDSADVAKLKVEGLAIRETPAAAGQPARVEAVVGLREPSDLVRVFAADLDESGSTPPTFRRLFAFDAGSREGVAAQLTSLLYLPSWKGFFVVTATEDKDNVFHGNTLWFLGDDEIPKQGLAHPQKAAEFEVAMKAEGLAQVPGPDAHFDTSARLVVVFDNDAKSTHMPSRVQALRVSRRDNRND